MIELWQDYGQTCRIFTLNDNIISIIDVPELPGQIGPPRVNIIVRSMFGKFVWSGQMNLFGNQEVPSAVIGTNPTKIDLVPPAKYGHTPVCSLFAFPHTFIEKFRFIFIFRFLKLLLSQMSLKSCTVLSG